MIEASVRVRRTSGQISPGCQSNFFFLPPWLPAAGGAVLLLQKNHNSLGVVLFHLSTVTEINSHRRVLSICLNADHSHRVPDGRGGYDCIIYIANIDMIMIPLPRPVLGSWCKLKETGFTHSPSEYLRGPYFCPVITLSFLGTPCRLRTPPHLRF